MKTVVSPKFRSCLVFYGKDFLRGCQEFNLLSRAFMFCILVLYAGCDEK